MKRIMKQSALLAVLLLLHAALSACAPDDGRAVVLGGQEEQEQPGITEGEENNNDDGYMSNNTILLTVNGRSFTATLEDNSSARALVEHLAQWDLQVRMEDCGDMEKVGPLGFSLPRNDVRITTSPGDLILYQGDMLTIYYDVNTWSFTRLGHVDGVSTREEMLELLGGKGTVTVTLSVQPGTTSAR